MNAQTDNKTPPAEEATNNIGVTAKILSIDPFKGDVSARVESDPNGNFVKEDVTLARNIKLDINSSHGKQEMTFEKGKKNGGDRTRS